MYIYVCIPICALFSFIYLFIHSLTRGHRGSLNSGAPYLLTAIVTFFAFLHSFEFHSIPFEEASVPTYEFKSINYSLESNDKMSLLAGDGYYSDDEYEDEVHI
jgi:hypothetical protein